MNFKLLYNIQTNFICIVVFILLLHRYHHNSKDKTTSEATVQKILMLSMVYCIFDLINASLQGISYTGSTVILNIINSIIYISMILISCYWLFYVIFETNAYSKERKKWSIFLMVPMIINIILVTLVNPFTGFMFYISSDSYYHRGDYISLFFVVTAFYILYAEYLIIKTMIIEKNKYKRKQLQPLLYFSIFSLVAAIIEVVVIGVSTTQVGILLSVLLLYEGKQFDMVHIDSLTKLENRRALEKRKEDIVRRFENKHFTAIMMDVDHFKEINDCLGHGSGDIVIKVTAQAIKNATDKITKRVFLCRYGGDEFLILGNNFNQEDIDNFKENLYKELKIIEKEFDLPFKLNISIGVATYECKEEADIEHIINMADERMYQDKKINSFKPFA